MSKLIDLGSVSRETKTENRIACVSYTSTLDQFSGSQQDCNAGDVCLKLDNTSDGYQTAQCQ